MSETERSKEDTFRVERWSEVPKGEEPACADCGKYCDLIGPLSHDGQVIEGADMVCPNCAEARGLDLSHCTCGTSSPTDMTCPRCKDYLGYKSQSFAPGVDRDGGEADGGD